MLEGGQRPTTIQSLPLAMARFSGIKSELSGWATAEISFEFNPKGTHLFSIFELAYAYAKRCDDLTRSIESLIAASHIVPATIVGRALIETIAMGSFFISAMDRLIAHGKLENLEKRFTSFWGGSKQQVLSPSTSTMPCVISRRLMESMCDTLMRSIAFSPRCLKH